MPQKNDLYFMREALRLAYRAQCRTRPNPMVGAVVVRDGRIIASGFHKKAGTAHAEIIALGNAGKNSQGATLYVTLEPCCHYGRTPPCTAAIIKAGIKTVVTAMRDPNPLNNGRGLRCLAMAGIKTKVLNLRAAQLLNRVFIKYITKKLPFVTVKIAQSLDGKITTASGESKWITSLEARRAGHRLRKSVDAVMVGINTVLKDNPVLTTHLPGTQPAKVLLDTKLRATPDLNIFSSKSPALTIVATAAGNKRKFFKFKNKNILFLTFPLKNGKIPLRPLLKKLAMMEMSHVLIEGGAEVIGSAFEENVVDSLAVFISPRIIGGKKALSAVGGRGISSLAAAQKLKNISVKFAGKDLLIKGDI